MASRPKRKYTSVREQDGLLESFYQYLDQEDEDFLGNRCIGEDEGDFYSEDSDSNGGNDEPAAVEESEEPEIDESEMTHDKENNTDKGNDNEHSKTSTEIPRKQKFKTLDAVLDENNYEDAPPQGGLLWNTVILK